jgi:hypothetical protein
MELSSFIGVSARLGATRRGSRFEVLRLQSQFSRSGRSGLAARTAASRATPGTPVVDPDLAACWRSTGVVRAPHPLILLILTNHPSLSSWAMKRLYVTPCPGGTREFSALATPAQNRTGERPAITIGAVSQNGERYDLAQVTKIESIASKPRDGPKISRLPARGAWRDSRHRPDSRNHIGCVRSKTAAELIRKVKGC